jgi:hypothetical protein
MKYMHREPEASTLWFLFRILLISYFPRSAPAMYVHPSGHPIFSFPGDKSVIMLRSDPLYCTPLNLGGKFPSQEAVGKFLATGSPRKNRTDTASSF